MDDDKNTFKAYLDTLTEAERPRDDLETLRMSNAYRIGKMDGVIAGCGLLEILAKPRK